MRKAEVEDKPPCKCLASTNIADEISCGTGELDFYGFWEFPCTHGLAQWLKERLNLNTGPKEV